MLADMHLLEAIETLWNLEDPDILSTTNDIFAFMVESNPSMVREFCLTEAKINQVGLYIHRPGPSQCIFSILCLAVLLNGPPKHEPC